MTYENAHARLTVILGSTFGLAQSMLCWECTIDSGVLDLMDMLRISEKFQTTDLQIRSDSDAGMLLIIPKGFPDGCFTWRPE